METHYNSSTKYTEYASNSNDLDIVRTEKYNIIINSVTGGWAEVKDSELALLMFGESFYDMNFGEKAYQAGLIKKNGSYIFDLNEVNHSINKLYMFEFRVTDMCNLNCIYCSSEACNSNSERPNLKIAYQWVDRVYEYIKEKKVRSVSIEFTGGEPLLFTEYLEELINYASTKFQQITGLNVNYVICTNGTLLDNEKAKWLNSYMNTISLSIDGNKEMHNANRKYTNGKGTYEDIIYNLKNAVLNKEKVRIRITVNSKTVHSLADSITHMVELGFRTIIPSVVYEDFCLVPAYFSKFI
ncbi:hypothetical protein CG709_17200 [Lachnotalea glycerini]|nr:hypothetical protein CG709_17200 [Lachnotalea glycerini]